MKTEIANPVKNPYQVTPVPHPPKIERLAKKGNRGRLLKILLGLAFLAGAGIILYSNNNPAGAGLHLEPFAAYLP